MKSFCLGPSSSPEIGLFKCFRDSWTHNDRDELRWHLRIRCVPTDWQVFSLMQLSLQNKVLSSTDKLAMTRELLSQCNFVMCGSYDTRCDALGQRDGKILYSIKLECSRIPSNFQHRTWRPKCVGGSGVYSLSVHIISVSPLRTRNLLEISVWLPVWCTPKYGFHFQTKQGLQPMTSTFSNLLSTTGSLLH